MESLPNIAVAGANGRLGEHVINSIISPLLRPKFGQIIALVRISVAQSKIEEWGKKGIAVRVYNEENMIEVLQDVDTLINVLSSKGHHYKDAIAKALPSTNISLYFPSEFGVDHTIHEFKQEFWDAKKQHYDDVCRLAPNIKISRVYVGLFTEHSIAPWLGFDTKTDVYQCVGSPDAKISFTSKEDSGRAVATLASLPLGAIPDEVHIAGDSVSFNEIAKMVQGYGVGPVIIKSLGLKDFKELLMKEPSASPAGYIRFLAGEGRIDHRKEGLGCDNDLVNEGESKWEWKTLAKLAEEKRGKLDA